MSTREERLESINLLLKEIGTCGRKFFSHNESGEVSYFYLKGDKRKRLWFHDKYGGDINPYPSNFRRDYKFSEGGTLWALMHDFSEYIITGKYTNGNNGYGGLYSPHWGYPQEDMDSIIEFAKEIGFLRS